MLGTLAEQAAIVGRIGPTTGRLRLRATSSPG